MPIPSILRSTAAAFVLCTLNLAVSAPAVPIDPEASHRAIVELGDWLKAPHDQRGALEGCGFAAIPLTKADAEEAKKALWADHAARIAATRKAEMDAKSITLGGLTMKFDTLDFGSKENPPTGGRSLFLSMHGGGNAPSEVNESQWHNQVKLGNAYKPAEGIYLAPRAPTDTWDLWHQSHIDQFFQRIIENLIVLDHVNPNRVYVMGYSAGGDGVYQLGPRMADFWAAASMMAGHPNDASPLGLRNIGFAIQVGANDGAYHRNEIAAEWGRKLDDLQKADPTGYAHFSELHEGRAHWMNLEDRKAIPWMEKFTRNPRPEKVVWHQSNVIHTRFYWLAVPKDEAHGGQDIVAERSGPNFHVTAKDGETVLIRLNDAIVDLDQPITVIRDGHAPVQTQAVRTIGTLAATLEERGDPELIFSAEIKTK